MRLINEGEVSVSAESANYAHSLDHSINKSRTDAFVINKDNSIGVRGLNQVQEHE